MLLQEIQSFAFYYKTSLYNKTRIHKITISFNEQLKNTNSSIFQNKHLITRKISVSDFLTRSFPADEERERQDRCRTQESWRHEFGEVDSGCGGALCDELEAVKLKELLHFCRLELLQKPATDKRHYGAEKRISVQQLILCDQSLGVLQFTFQSTLCRSSFQVLRCRLHLNIASSQTFCGTTKFNFCFSLNTVHRLQVQHLFNPNHQGSFWKRLVPFTAHEMLHFLWSRAFAEL